MQKFKITNCPNNWITKAGGYIDSNGKFFLPHKFLLAQMHTASEAIEQFNKSKLYSEQIKAIQLMSINVRSAETIFFRKVAEILNKKINEKICYKCIRDTLFETDLKKIRRGVNSKIIHRLDYQEFVNPKDFHFAIDYYNEIFKLPLTGELVIKIDEESISLCYNCLNKKIKCQKDTDKAEK